MPYCKAPEIPVSEKSKQQDYLLIMWSENFGFHPWSGDCLSLNIDRQDQTCWKSILELKRLHSIQMKFELHLWTETLQEGLYNVPYWGWAKVKVYFKDLYCTQFFRVNKIKVVHLKKLISQIGVHFLIRCIFDHTQHPPLDFWRNLFAHFNFI